MLVLVLFDLATQRWFRLLLVLNTMLVQVLFGFEHNVGSGFFWF